MFERSSCVRVSNIPFAKDRVERGKWVFIDNPETGKRELVRWQDRHKHVAPYIQGDTIEPVQSMVNGQWYDSKSALRAHYRAEGYVEVGNDLLGYRGAPACQTESYQESLRETMRAHESPSWVEEQRQRREREGNHT